MSFLEVINQHWDQIHVLSQLCVIIAQSSLERQFPNVEDYFFGDDSKEHESTDSNDIEQKYKLNLNLMYKIVTRVLSIAKEIDHLSDTHCVFYWISRQKDIDLNKLQNYSNTIINLCDKLMNEMQNRNRNENEMNVSRMNIIELNEYIEILKYKHLTLRHLSYALNEDGIVNNTIRLNKSLDSILESINICSKTNYLIKLFNKLFEENSIGIGTQNSNSMELDVRQMIENGELDIREENDIICCYHFGANLCQKMNKFCQSLDLINKSISIMKTHLILTFKNRINDIAEPVTSDDENENENENESESEINNELMDIDCDNNKIMEIDYEINMELSEDIKKMLLIKAKNWNDMNSNEKLFYFINRELFDMILTRGLAHSNLNKYKLAFYDSYMCTLIYPNNTTAWNNRAFAWYQLGEYYNCIIDCNYALNKLPKIKQNSFTRGLLIGNRGLSEYKLKLYHKSVNDLNICLKYSPQSRLAREALHGIWKEFTNAIYYGCTKININIDSDIEIPFVIAKIIADYGVGIDFDIIPQCHQSTIVYQ